MIGCFAVLLISNILRRIFLRTTTTLIEYSLVLRVEGSNAIGKTIIARLLMPLVLVSYRQSQISDGHRSECQS